MIRAGDRVEAAVTLGMDSGMRRELEFEVGSQALFGKLMERTQGVWCNTGNRERVMPLLPEPLREQISGREFFAMSLHVTGAPSGLIYADGGDSCGGLDESRYNAFKQVCTAAAQALERLTA
jgi:hypothetical protein